jgi:hypothetical protein
MTASYLTFNILITCIVRNVTHVEVGIFCFCLNHLFNFVVYRSEICQVFCNTFFTSPAVHTCCRNPVVKKRDGTDFICLRLIRLWHWRFINSIWFFWLPTITSISVLWLSVRASPAYVSLLSPWTKNRCVPVYVGTSACCTWFVWSFANISTQD